MNRNHIIALSLLALLAILSIGGYVMSKGQEKSDETRWLTYSNKEYGFELQYPSNTTIEPRQDTGHQYIRFQNYGFENSPRRPASEEYFLEIFIVDKKLGHAPWKPPCEQSLINPQKVDTGTSTSYRGLESLEGLEGDVFGTRLVLCIKRPDVQLYIRGVQMDARAPTANRILDSFRFTN